MGIRIVLRKKENLKNNAFITGFHGIGVTGYIVIRHIIEILKPEPIGYIETDALPAFVGMDEDRLSLPFELFKKDKMVFLLPRFQPYRLEQREFAQEVAKWVVASEFSESIMVGGLDNRFKHSDHEIYCALTKTAHPIRDELDLPVLERGLYVTGLLALMLAYFDMDDFPALALLPYAERSRPDPRAAAIATKKINERYNLNIDTEQLISDATLIEQEIQEILRQQEERVKQEPDGMYL
ncbi:MAG: proteasome assembly chaperone family protein [Promethearchaeota archaeon]